MLDRVSILWHYARARRHFVKWRNHAALETWQAAQVERHLHRVTAKSPYFARIAAQHGVSNWRQWPVLGKAEMMRHFGEWNTAGVRQDDAWALALDAERTRDFSAMLGTVTVGMSSGTTGSRGLFLASATERQLWAGTLLARVLQGTLLRQNRAALFLRADSPLYRTIGSRRLQFGFFDLVTPLADQWPRLEAFRPTVLAAPPAVLLWLAAQSNATKLLAQPAILLSVADVLDAADRKSIESGFQCSVGQIYQATEGFLAATCPHGRLHWNEDALVIQKQWLDAERTRYTPIITDFRRFTQPIIRYRLDDVILEDKAGPCPCGSVFSTLGSIEGRCDDALILPKRDADGDITVFPDFVSRAVIVAVPAGVDYSVCQTSPARWDISFSADCDLLPVRQEVDKLCVQLRALAPELRLVPWVPPALDSKRRRIRLAFAPAP